jgi:hypothetical protein
MSERPKPLSILSRVPEKARNFPTLDQPTRAKVAEPTAPNGIRGLLLKNTSRRVGPLNNACRGFPYRTHNQI